MSAGTAPALESVELRRYVMKPARRDDLIAIFERDFIESQEACGMMPVGHYRDPADPGAYVWFRGFPQAENRREALEAFYERSEAWKRNRDAANDTMIDSDNVLMLRPLFAHSGFDLHGLQRPARGETSPPSVVALAVFMLHRSLSGAAAAAFERDVLPQLRQCAQRVAVFVSDENANDYPRLPVRREPALVVTGIPGEGAGIDAWERALDPRRLPGELGATIAGAEFLRLEPAARSLYR